MNKKVTIVIGIIVLAILILIFSKNPNSKNENQLPTRDTEGYDTYASVEDFCTQLSDAQEFDDSQRYASFYETCLVENK